MFNLKRIWPQFVENINEVAIGLVFISKIVTFMKQRLFVAWRYTINKNNDLNHESKIMLKLSLYFYHFFSFAY